VWRSNFVCWPTSTCTVWHPSTCHDPACHSLPSLDIHGFAQLTTDNLCCVYDIYCHASWVRQLSAHQAQRLNWNSLRVHLRHPDLTISAFKRQLKTVLHCRTVKLVYARSRDVRCDVNCACLNAGLLLLLSNINSFLLQPNNLNMISISPCLSQHLFFICARSCSSIDSVLFENH